MSMVSMESEMSKVPVLNSHTYQKIRGLKSIQNIQSVATVQSYIYPTLPVDSTHDIIISSIIDGLKAFTIQLKKSCDVDLPKLMAKINDIRPVLYTEQIGPGALCLGRFTQNSSLRRAVVSNVSAEGASLYFVDFGNTDFVPLNEIYRIPDEFLQQATMALRFGLTDVTSNSLDTEEARSEFSNLVLHEGLAFKLKVLKPLLSSQQSCDLFIVSNRKTFNIKNKILDKMKLMKLVEYEKTPFETNQVHDVIVTFVESPCRLFVQLKENRGILDYIEKYCNDDENRVIRHVEDVVKNMAVCAPFEYNTYYRGIIVDEPDDEGYVTVFYVDYGNQDTVHYSLLRIMNNEVVSQFPTQAVECRLDIDSALVNNEELTNKFIELTNGRNFKMTVRDILLAHVLLVDLIDSKGLNVGEYLMANFGMKSSSVYAALLKAQLQKSSSGNCREKNSASMEEFSSSRDSDSVDTPNKAAEKYEFEKSSHIADAEYQPDQKILSVISWFVNPLNFFIKPATNIAFENLMDDIQSGYPARKTLNANELSPNDCVVARDEDNVLRRAIILRTSSRGVVVRFVDYGNTATVDANHIWAIKPEHCLIPKQAVFSSLQEIELNEENRLWTTSDHNDYFRKDTYAATFVEYIEQDGSMAWIVDLMGPDGRDVADVLVEFGIVKRKPVFIHKRLRRMCRHLMTLPHDVDEFGDDNDSRKVSTPLEVIQNKNAPHPHVMHTLVSETNYPARVTSWERTFGPPLEWEDSEPSINCEVTVDRIPDFVFEDELILIFGRIGTLYSLRLIVNPITKNHLRYAFVTFTNSQDAKKAIEKVHNYEIRPNHRLIVELNQNRSTIILWNISKVLTKAEIFEEIDRITNELISVEFDFNGQNEGTNRGFCFLKYSSSQSALLAKGVLKNEINWGEHVKITWTMLKGAMLENELHICLISDGYEMCSCIIKMISEIENLGKEISSLEEKVAMQEPNKVVRSKDVNFTQYLHHSLAIESLALDQNEEKLAAATKYAFSLRDTITENDIFQIFKLLEPEDEDNRPAKDCFRSSCEEECVVFDGFNQAVKLPPVEDIPHLWSKCLSSLNDEEHVIMKAAKISVDYVIMHPHPDGNGRISRILFNTILRRENFPVITFYREDKMQYYEAIGIAGREKNYTEYQRFICSTILKSLRSYKKMLES